MQSAPRFYAVVPYDARRVSEDLQASVIDQGRVLRGMEYRELGHQEQVFWSIQGMNAPKVNAGNLASPTYLSYSPRSSKARNY